MKNASITSIPARITVNVSSSRAMQYTVLSERTIDMRQKNVSEKERSSTSAPSAVIQVFKTVLQKQCFIQLPSCLDYSESLIR